MVECIVKLAQEHNVSLQTSIKAFSYSVRFHATKNERPDMLVYPLQLAKIHHVDFSVAVHEGGLIANVRNLDALKLLSDTAKREQTDLFTPPHKRRLLCLSRGGAQR